MATTTGPRHGRRRPTSFRRRRIATAVGAMLLAVLLWAGFSLGQFMVNPAYGTSLSARAAEWAREHGGASMVASVEQWWYSHHKPPVGGSVQPGTFTPGTTPSTTIPNTIVHLAVPPRVLSPAQPQLAGEGIWHPVGRSVQGVPAIYQAVVRVDPVHTSIVAHIAWMDTALLSARLYSGSFVPGHGPFHYTAPVTAASSKTLVSAFNAGFRMQDANGGYYTDGRTVFPLRQGAASYVIFKNGTSTVGQWGVDVSMSPMVESVRQNLDLIVKGGAVSPAINSTSFSQWGLTLGGATDVWRSGLGVTKNGALVYVGAPALSINTLADLLVRAGAVRAMELDINTDWVQYSTFTYPKGGAASPANGTSLDPTMAGSPARYYASWWSRDFITMSARSAAAVTNSAHR